MRFSLFVNCKEAGHFCDRAQYDEATFREKLLLRIHILFCAACRKHSMRNYKLTQLLRRSELKTMGQGQKQAMRDLIEKELSR